MAWISLGKGINIIPFFFLGGLTGNCSIGVRGGGGERGADIKWNSPII